VNSAASPSVSTWWELKHFLESAIESGLRVVANALRDLHQRHLSCFEKTRSRLQPPMRQIAHGRFTEKVHETLRDDGARCADRLRNNSDGPRARRIAMEGRAASHPIRWLGSVAM
jgi:hypothetical protein